MTKKDFELIARAICAARMDFMNKEPDESLVDLQGGADYVAEYLAVALANANPKFNRARFLAACGVTQ